jgi:CheY-like chemotaxis protein
MPLDKTRILLVEDNLGDADLMKEALTEGGHPVEITVARDGFAALAFLHRTGDYTGAFRPDLVILDLNLPKKDGREVLAEVKSDENLKTIPVVVLSTSVSAEDVWMSYRLGANSFINKPMGVDALFDMVGKLEEYWFRIVKLPKAS